jgi:hypothetical protein
VWTDEIESNKKESGSIETGEEIIKKKDKMLIYKMQKKNTPSPHQMKKNRVIRVILNAHLKTG